jgi:ribose transport system ATP-binding protein
VVEQLRVRELCKEFPGVRAVDHVSLTLHRNDVLGLVGENGAGKSTLLKLLVGVYGADRGEIILAGKPIRPNGPLEAAKLGLYMVFQELSLVPNLRVYENLLLGKEAKYVKFGMLDVDRMKDDARGVIDKYNLKMNPDFLTADLTLPERFLLETARAIESALSSGTKPLGGPVVIFDEVTAALGGPEVEQLFKQVQRLKQTASVIFVSHRLPEVIEICDKICVMKDGNVVTVVDQRETKVSESRLHELMVGRSRDTEFYKEDDQKPYLGEIALAVQNLTSSTHAREKFYDVTYDLHRGEILGIGGVIGSGKSDLGRAIVGALRADRGCVEVKGKSVVPDSTSQMIGLGVCYLPGDKKSEGIIQDLSVAWNMTLPSLSKISYSKFPILDVGRERSLTNQYFEKLSIRAPSIKTPCRFMSGGNQQKVVIAKWLLKDFDVIVVDNPTRGVDVGAKEEIYGLLRELAEQGSAVILITDDLLELIGLSSRIIAMKDGRITRIMEASPHEKPTEKEVVACML